MKHLGRAFFAFLTFVVIVLWWQTPWIVKALEGTGKAPVELGTFGDIYGTTNALFSGLAFLGLIYTIYLQRLDLKQNMEELKLSRLEVAATNDALREQTRQMQITAKLSAIPTLMEHHKAVLHTLAPLTFGPRENSAYDIGTLDRLAEIVSSRHVQSDGERQASRLQGLAPDSLGSKARMPYDLYRNKDQILCTVKKLRDLTIQLHTIEAVVQSPIALCDQALDRAEI